ncbi:MAG: glycolate oxidase subunit GlcE [Rhodoferax sp.]|nr:glycolate oxidase subunit GlcE [Rhodoferax sp.]
MPAQPFLQSAIPELAERVRQAVARGTAVHIRGGGSKDFYGATRSGDLLETAGLRGIISYEPSELVVTAGAGTPLQELEELLASEGQCLAFEPPHFARSQPALATVGGMVATGLAGPARASVGGVRDYVLGLQLINGRAEHLTFGGQVMKNVAGYDVSRLMVGAMGTLGLITQVSLKVLPKFPAEATLVFELGQAEALEHLHRWGGQPLPLNASCWVRDPTAGTGSDLLFVRLRGAVAAVEAACKKMLAEVAGQRMDTAQAAADWALCRDQALPFFARAPQQDMALWRLSLPQTAPVLDLPWPQLVEWHGGLRWLWAPHDVAARLSAVAQGVGGSASIFVAAPAHPSCASGHFDTKSAATTEIAKRLKASFDPHGVFNPSLVTNA